MAISATITADWLDSDHWSLKICDVEMQCLIFHFQGSWHFTVTVSKNGLGLGIFGMITIFQKFKRLDSLRARNLVYKLSNFSHHLFKGWIFFVV